MDITKTMEIEMEEGRIELRSRNEDLPNDIKFDLYGIIESIYEFEKDEVTRITGYSGDCESIFSFNKNFVVDLIESIKRELELSINFKEKNPELVKIFNIPETKKEDDKGKKTKAK